MECSRGELKLSLYSPDFSLDFVLIHLAYNVDMIDIANYY